MYIAQIMKFYKVIRVLNLKHERIYFKIWDNMPFEMVNKWNWYFNYRAALLQVQYPKFKVELTSGSAIAESKSIIAERYAKNQIRAKKAKITEMENKMKLARENWNDLFPIYDYPLYQKAVEKLNRLRFELIELENENNGY